MTSAIASRRRRRTLASLAVFVGLFLLSPGEARSDSSGGGISATILASDGQLRVELHLQPAHDIEQGRAFRVTASVTNMSASQLDSGEAVLFVDVSGLRVLSRETATLPSLRVGESRSIRWTVRAEEVGLYVITVEASAQDETGGALHGDANATLRVVERAKPGVPAPGLE